MRVQQSPQVTGGHFLHDAWLPGRSHHGSSLKGMFVSLHDQTSQANWDPWLMGECFGGLRCHGYQADLSAGDLPQAQPQTWHLTATVSFFNL